MTGGIGFSRWAQNNNSQNLNLRKKRKKQKDNPYSPVNPGYKRTGFDNFQEIVDYKENTRRRNKKIILFINVTLFLLILVGVIILINVL